jgi:hypothetical protein
MRKTGKTADASPISHDLKPPALPKSVVVEGRVVPIFPVSVLLELAAFVKGIQARQAEEGQSTGLNDSSRPAPAEPARSKRKGTKPAAGDRDSAADAAAEVQPPARREKARRPRRKGNST